MGYYKNLELEMGYGEPKKYGDLTEEDYASEAQGLLANKGD